ncbi:hypothetical protein HPB50_028075 [Hyalomma asiaticum]|nr:hypothetical protein HPB50_028075 [Hyalomma asiaticum]
MVFCAVFGCNNRSQTKEEKLQSNAPDPRFFKIPKVRLNECEQTRVLSERRRREWLARINRKGLDANVDKYKVCSKHFISGQPSQLFDTCSPDWAPSQHLGYGDRCSEPQLHRYERLKRRRSAVATTIAPSMSPAEESEVEESAEPDEEPPADGQREAAVTAAEGK